MCLIFFPNSVTQNLVIFFEREKGINTSTEYSKCFNFIFHILAKFHTQNKVLVPSMEKP